MFLINIGKNDIYSLTKFYNCSMTPWSEKPGTPKKPVLYDYIPFKDSFGKGGMQFDVEYTSTDGVYLDPNKMYYNIYFDGSYTGDYSEGDRVSVGWAYFGGETREVLWIERLA